MAQSGGFNTVLRVGLLAGGAYLAYRAFTSATPAAVSGPTGSLSLTDLGTAINAAGSTPGPVLPASPPPVDNSALVAQLNAAAAADPALVGGKMSAFQWNYYLNRSPHAVPDTQFAAAFPQGANLISADTFVATLQSHGGLSGLGAVVPVPILVSVGDGRRVMVWGAPGISGPAVFGARHPFAVGARPLPVPAWRQV